MWFTDDQNQWVQASRHVLQWPKSMSPAQRHDLPKINESSTRDMIYKLPKSMSPGLQMWFTESSPSMSPEPSRHDLQWLNFNDRWPKSMSPGLQTSRWQKSMSPALETWFTNYQNQWVHVIYRWPKSMSTGLQIDSKSPDQFTDESMSPALQMWFTDDQNLQTLQVTKINESSTRDMIYKIPKSMSPALETWFTNYQNQWVQCPQMTKINESRQTWFTNYQNQWVHGLQMWFTDDQNHRWPKCNLQTTNEWVSLIYQMWFTTKMTKINESNW